MFEKPVFAIKADDGWMFINRYEDTYNVCSDVEKLFHISGDAIAFQIHFHEKGEWTLSADKQEYVLVPGYTDCYKKGNRYFSLNKVKLSLEISRTLTNLLESLQIECEESLVFDIIEYN